MIVQLYNWSLYSIVVLREDDVNGLMYEVSLMLLLFVVMSN